jgi:antitoxin (DNA-binding transcriptional repressor) of toxin-antitoxin stability system
MRRVGSTEARTRLPSLLAEVEAGARIIITRHGVDVAELSRSTGARREDISAVIAHMKERRARRASATTEEVLSWRDEGRKPVE